MLITLLNLGKSLTQNLLSILTVSYYFNVWNIIFIGNYLEFNYNKRLSMSCDHKYVLMHINAQLKSEILLLVSNST